MQRRFGLLLAGILSVGVCVSASATTRTWTGASSANWSDAANWSPTGVPANGESLVFPQGASHLILNNDLTNFSAGAITLGDDAYFIKGNALTLLGDLNATSNAQFTLNMNLAADSHFVVQGTAAFYGDVNMNGHTLSVSCADTRFNGAINGSGRIIIQQGGLATFYTGGTFSGSIEGGVNLRGAAYPGMNLVMPAGYPSYLIGFGTIGNVAVAATPVASAGPGYISPGSSSNSAIHTGSLNLGGDLDINLNIPPYPEVFANGNVTLSGRLAVNYAYAPPLGQKITIIDNDGADPVNGTFTGLPEGAAITVGDLEFVVSYHGGDGNDVVLTTIRAPRKWVGAYDTLWSHPFNWSPTGIPFTGERLLFPDGAGSTFTNDLPPGFYIGQLTFGASNATTTLNGNLLTLAEGIDFTGANMAFVCNIDLKISFAAHLGAGAAYSEYNGAVDVNGSGFYIDGSSPVFHGPINGSGAIFVTGPGITISSSGAFSGPISGSVNLSGSMPGLNKTGPGFLSGNGAVGTVTTASADAAVAPGVRTPCCDDRHTAGVLHTSSISLGGPYDVDLFPGGSSDLLQVTGTVTLRGPLVVSIPTGSPVPGQAFTIIDNDGSDPVNGTLADRPEGATFGVGPYTFRITYRGGDGNDVVLTVVTDTTTAITASSPATIFGGQVTFTSTVSSGFGLPTGVVTFLDGNLTLGTAPLQSGVALFTTSTLTAGAHQIAAAYSGNAGFAPSSSGTSVTVTVARAPATLAVHTSQNPSKAGEDVVVSVVIASGNPQLLPSGGISVSENGQMLAQQTISGNSLAINLGGLSSGAHQLTVVFDGGANFETSSQTITQTVLQPSIDIDDASVTEGDSGTRVVSVPVHLAARSSETITVKYQSHDETAKAGEDYLPVDGTLTFAPGETGKFIEVTVIGDTTFEDNETLGITLSEPVNATLQGGPATVTIVNDDASYRKSTFAFATIGNTQLMLDVDTPLAGNGPFPAIVWVGGSTSYAPGGDSPALRETARGYVVVIPTYRAAGQAPFPAQLDDLQTAIRWIRANAATLHVDAGHIGIWGGGTGAHLASLAGTTADRATPASLAEGNAAMSNRVQAVVDWAGPAALGLLQSDQAASASCVPSYGDAASQPSILIGCALPACIDAANAASPESFVSADDAPILIMHGANDCVVPPEQSQRFYDALKAAHVDATLRLIDGLGAFGSSWDPSVPWPVVDAFLDAHLKGISSKRRAAGR